MVEPSACDLAAVADAYAHAGQSKSAGVASMGGIHTKLEDQGEEPEDDDTPVVLSPGSTSPN